MEFTDLQPHIEALIFASDKPLTSEEIAELVNATFGYTDEADKLSLEQVDAALDGIVEKYSSELYPFEVRQSGGGWQFLTKKEYHKAIAQLNGEKFLKRLSAAALETLAIIAYKQPITKGEIEAIRGVSSDYSVQKLLEKDLIVISGRNEKLPGHPLVYATSKSFMDYFGINSPEDLPKIREVLADQVVEPTVVHHTELDEPSDLVVTGEGELVEPLAGDTEVNGHDVAEFITQATNDGEADAGDSEKGARLFLHDNEEEPDGETKAADESKEYKNGASYDFTEAESKEEADEEIKPEADETEIPADSDTDSPEDGDEYDTEDEDESDTDEKNEASEQ